MSSSHYPPGVTGAEPQICGSGLEDFCTRCMEFADEDTPLSAIPLGLVTTDTEYLCADCARNVLKEKESTQ